MAIAASEVARAYNNADATSYNTAAFTPAANSFLSVFYATRHATTAPGATITGHGLTWNVDEAAQVDGISAIGSASAQVGASPGSAAITLTMAGGVTAIGCFHSVIQVTGHDTSGTVVQSPIAATGLTGATGTVTFAAPGSANNLFIAHFMHRGATATTTEAGWTAGTDSFGATPNHGSRTMWRLAVDTTATATWTSVRWQGSGIEVKELVAGGAAKLYVPIARRNHLGQTIGRA